MAGSARHVYGAPIDVEELAVADRATCASACGRDQPARGNGFSIHSNYVMFQNKTVLLHKYSLLKDEIHLLGRPAADTSLQD